MMNALCAFIAVYGAGSTGIFEGRGVRVSSETQTPKGAQHETQVIICTYRLWPRRFTGKSRAFMSRREFNSSFSTGFGLPHGGYFSNRGIEQRRGAGSWQHKGGRYLKSS